MPASGTVYWAVDAQSASPGAYLWMWLENTAWNASSVGNIIQFAGQDATTPPGFWRIQRFSPGNPSSLTEAAGWPEGGTGDYPAYPSDSLTNYFS